MRRSKGRKIFNIIVSALLLLDALFPNYWLISLAIRNTAELSGNISILPKTFTLEHFGRLFTDKDYTTIIKNSLIATLISTAFSLTFGLAAAYIMVRRRFQLWVKAPLTVWVLLIRILPPVAFIIPLYTTFSKTGLLGTRVPIILACILINLPLIIWFMMTFFRDLPEEVEQSAKIDGATEFQLFNLTQFGLVAAGGVISVIPITLFVIFAQNYLIAGLSSGAVKE